ncbi:MAG: hypothetical protein NC548_32355 [Lachnospiraceae bacterium]|nr:hypothetical protein [Lachnospiraceae bacterium]
MKIFMAKADDNANTSGFLLKLLADAYRPEYFKARITLGHPGSEITNPAFSYSYGIIHQVWFEDDVLWGDVEFNESGLELIKNGMVTYVSIGVTLFEWEADEVPDEFPYPYMDSQAAIRLGTKAGFGYMLDEEGELIGGHGAYLAHLALLGAQNPAVLGQPTLQEQLKEAV